MKYALLTILTLLPSSAVAGPNFIGAAPVYLQRAEECRHEIAVWWIGKPLPNWSKPCPINVTVQPGGHSGETRFVFDRGEVFGWQMDVRGSHEKLLEDVIPHEVCHTIIASLVRRMNVRWLNEGSCQQFESRAHRAQMRQMAVQYANHPGGVWQRFDAMDYPNDGESTMAMYATGCSVVEWLLQLRDRDTLLAFTMDRQRPSQKLVTHYGLSPAQARQQWSAWLQGGPTAVPSDSSESLPVVWVVSTALCGACNALKADIAAGKYPGVKFQYLDWNNPEHHAGIRRITAATGRQITSVPTLWQEGSTVMYPPANVQRPPAVWDWFKDTLMLVPRSIEDMAGVPRSGQPPTSIPIGQPLTFPDSAPSEIKPAPQDDGLVPIPADPPEEDVFHGVTVIFTAAAQDVSALRGGARRLALEQLIPAIERQFAELTGGDARLAVVPERTLPTRFAAVTEAAEIPGDGWHVLVLVPAQSSGIRQVIRAKVAELVRDRLPDAVRDAPVGLLSETVSEGVYRATIAALETPEPPPPPPAAQDPVEGGDPVSPAEGGTWWRRLLVALVGSYLQMFGVRRK